MSETCCDFLLQGSVCSVCNGSNYSSLLKFSISVNFQFIAGWLSLVILKKVDVCLWWEENCVFWSPQWCFQAFLTIRLISDQPLHGNTEEILRPGVLKESGPVLGGAHRSELIIQLHVCSRSLCLYFKTILMDVIALWCAGKSEEEGRVTWQHMCCLQLSESAF